MSSAQEASLDAKSERKSGSAPIATGELDKSDEECPSPEVVLPKSSSLSNTPSKGGKPPVDTTLPQQRADASGSPIQQFFLDESFAPQSSGFGSKGYQNFEDELYTFEEFLDFTDQPVLTDRIDEFHSIALDSPVREPKNPVVREPQGRERNYTVSKGEFHSTRFNYYSVADSPVPRLPYQLSSTPFPEHFETPPSDQRSSSDTLPVADFSHPQVLEPSPNPVSIGPNIPPRDSVNENMGLIQMICCLKPQNRSHHYHAPSETATPAAPNRPTQYSW